MALPIRSDVCSMPPAVEPPRKSRSTAPPVSTTTSACASGPTTPPCSPGSGSPSAPDHRDDPLDHVGRHEARLAEPPGGLQELGGARAELDQHLARRVLAAGESGGHRAPHEPGG